MADSTLDDGLFWLVDRWPGCPAPNVAEPRDGFTGSDHHNVATAVYDVGTKIQVYDTTNKGHATLMYLQVGTQDADTDIAVKSICAPEASTWYKVSNDSQGVNATALAGAVAIALSAMTDGYYGWFWVGGVCPMSYIPGLDGNYATKNDVVQGGFTLGTISADSSLGFAALAASGDDIFIGIALSADA